MHHRAARRRTLLLSFHVTLCTSLTLTSLATAKPTPAPAPEPDAPHLVAPPGGPLLAPEEVVTAMELYEAHPNNTAAGTAAASAYVNALPTAQRDAYTAYFVHQAAVSRDAAYQRYVAEATYDPTGALQTYQAALADSYEYDGPTPLHIPPPSGPGGTLPVVVGTEDDLVYPDEPNVPQCPMEALTIGTELEENVPPGCPGPSPQPPPPTPPPCPSYVDRFGNTWSRCNTTQTAFVFLHGAGSYGSYHSISTGYWGSTNLPGTAATRYFVSWSSTQSVQSQASTVRTALNALCAPTRPCIVIAHSAGGLMMGNLLAQGNPWNLLQVRAVQSAAGGSELANLTQISPTLWILNSLGLLQGIGGYPIYSLSLPTSIARGMYNHDATSGVPFLTYASERERAYRSCRWYQIGCHLDNAWSSTVNGALRALYNGGSDWLVAYHSSVGFRLDNSNTAHTNCNPDAPASGSGVPFTTLQSRSDYYWANHTSFHWQPPGQALACRRPCRQVQHSGSAMMRACL